MSATELGIILITVTHNQMEMKRVAAICRTAGCSTMWTREKPKARVPDLMGILTSLARRLTWKHTWV